MTCFAKNRQKRIVRRSTVRRPRPSPRTPMTRFAVGTVGVAWFVSATTTGREISIDSRRQKRAISPNVLFPFLSP